jgi:hypothetical protein
VGSLFHQVEACGHLQLNAPINSLEIESGVFCQPGKPIAQCADVNAKALGAALQMKAFLGQSERGFKQILSSLPVVETTKETRDEQPPRVFVALEDSRKEHLLETMDSLRFEVLDQLGRFTSGRGHSINASVDLANADGHARRLQRGPPGLDVELLRHQRVDLVGPRLRPSVPRRL